MNNVSLHDVRAALDELGKFRFGDMRVEDALHEIVRTTHAMFGVDGAGLMLTDAEQHLRSVAASDGRLRHLEELQIEHAEGPCIAPRGCLAIPLNRPRPRTGSRQCRCRVAALNGLGCGVIHRE